MKFVWTYQGVSGIIRRARDENDSISANLWLCLLDVDVECFRFFLARFHGKDWLYLERGLSVFTIFLEDAWQEESEGHGSKI